MEKSPLSLSLSLSPFVVGDFILPPRGHAALDNDSEITSDSAMTHSLDGEVCAPVCVSYKTNRQMLTRRSLAELIQAW